MDMYAKNADYCFNNELLEIDKGKYTDFSWWVKSNIRQKKKTEQKREEILVSNLQLLLIRSFFFTSERLPISENKKRSTKVSSLLPDCPHSSSGFLHRCWKVMVPCSVIAISSNFYTVSHFQQNFFRFLIFICSYL